MALCAKVGMNPYVFFEAVSGSGAATVSNLFLEIGPTMLNHDWEANVCNAFSISPEIIA